MGARSRDQWLYLEGGERTGEHLAGRLELAPSNRKLRNIKQKQAAWGEVILGRGDSESKAWSHREGEHVLGPGKARELGERP